MKKKYFILTIIVIFCMSLNAQQTLLDKQFYYYKGEKIYLQQSPNKIFLKFAPDIHREQVLALINADISLQLMQGTNFDECSSIFVILEEKNENNVYLPHHFKIQYT